MSSEDWKLAPVPAAIDTPNGRIKLNKLDETEVAKWAERWASEVIQKRKNQIFYAEKNYHKAVMRANRAKSGN